MVERRSLDTMEFNLRAQLILQRAQRNYHRWIHDEFQPWLGKRILEVGCGVGNQTKHLLAERPDLLVASDAFDDFITYVRKRFGKRITVEKVDLDDVKSIKRMRKHKFDTITSVNVLEHIKDDQRVLKEFYAILPKGGRIIMEVPAHMVLYSRMDKDLGHYRRYSKKELRTKVEKAGFKVRKIWYFNSVGFFAWYVKLKILRHDFLGEGNMKTFDRIVPLVRFMDKHILRKKVGNILIVVGEK